ncbi:hypothetical protein HS041_21695 [Planomonospora sp. ID67723]|uniref:hypothetical protein n=1 Tax=Planomonospora sp. ID67723 TaxID=2738134 RepID=UPI0018C41544|nr:hypothetical protein [Planomonospora sp. ID67723]MBG0830379.1 hypothetical protein [Planomonospora sp. ID67723]
MAVPQMKPAQAVAAGSTVPARALTSSLPLDVVLGLLVAVALPLAIVAIPNTVSVVSALLPPDVMQIDMVRAHGLALPAMVLTVPLAAVAVRRMRAAPILVGGLTLLALADAAGGYAGSPLVVGILRVAHGIGAGLLVPATLVAVWERPRFLRAVWAGVLAVSLLAAQAMALWPLDEATSWRITLQPYPMLTGVALALAALYLVLWLRSGQSATAGPGPSAAERGRLLMATTPAVGIVVLALGATFEWAPELIVVAAMLSVLALLGLASVGTFEGMNGRTLAYTMVAVGVVTLPTAAQVTYVGLGGLGGPGLSGLWPAFAVAGAAGLVAAVLAGQLKDAVMPLVAAGGLVVVVGGLCAVRFLLPAAGGPALIIPFLLLAVGAATALTSALRPSGAGAALFALSLFFPGVLAGFMLGSGILLLRLSEATKKATSAQALVDAYVSALHFWALVGGALVVVVITIGAILARRAAASPGTAAAGLAVGEEEKAAADTPGPASEQGAETGPGSWQGAGAKPEPEQGTGVKLESEQEAPAVPSPMSSPEDSGEDRPADA